MADFINSVHFDLVEGLIIYSVGIAMGSWFALMLKMRGGDGKG